MIERGPSLGGLAGTIDFGGHEVDRFYHVITPADQRMIAMAEEVGLGDQLRFTPGRRRLLRRRRDARLQRHRRPAALLAAEPAGAAAPGLVRRPVPAAQLLRQARRAPARDLAAPPLRQPGLVERIWKPLLDSRFDGDPSGLPATYLWARTRRMSGARSGKGSGGEEMGHIVGGHQRLIDAMVARAGELGVEALHRGAGRAAWRPAEDGSVTGVELERRDARVRPDDPDPAAAGPALPAARAPPGPAGALSAALARRRLPDRQGARARCFPTTRSTSPSRRR